MTGSGFHVEPASLLIGSAGFADLQNWWGTIHAGLAGSLADQAGMAGDDDAGYAFAAKYQPAAQAVADEVGRLYGQLGGIANGLYTMALNYIQTDADVSVDKMKPAELPHGQPDCDTASKRAEVPNVVGRTEGIIEGILAKFWPQGNPAKLRQAAGDWQILAQRLETLGTEGSRIAREVTTKNQSSAVDGFSRTWGQLHSDLCLAREPLINALTTAAQRLAAACQGYAEQIERQREHLEHLAEAAGIAVGVGVALTLVTGGLSDVAAGVGEAAIAGEAAVAVTEFTEAVVAADEIAVLAEVDAILEEAAASLTEITPKLVGPTGAVSEISLPGSTVAAATATAAGITGIEAALTAFSSQAAAAPYAGPIGPAPRDPASPFPPLSPADQAAFRSWMTQMGLAGRTFPANSPDTAPKPSAAEARAYQLRVAGDTEYRLYTSVPDGKGGERGIDADGVRPEDGAAIEAKYVAPTRGNCGSPYRLNNTDQVFQPVYEKVERAQLDEMQRYASALNDPRNKVTHVEIVTNDDKAAAYFEAMRQAQHVRGQTRIIR